MKEVEILKTWTHNKSEYRLLRTKDYGTVKLVLEHNVPDATGADAWREHASCNVRAVGEGFWLQLLAAAIEDGVPL